jgi:hypothetical protein
MVGFSLQKIDVIWLQLANLSRNHILRFRDHPMPLFAKERNHSDPVRQHFDPLHQRTRALGWLTRPSRASNRKASRNSL